MKVKEEKPKITLKTIVIFVSTIVLINVCFKLFDKKPSTDKILQEFASDYNKSLPKMVSPEVRFDSVSSSENRIQYNMTVLNVERENVEIEKIQSDLRRDLGNSLRNNPNLKAFRDNNVGITCHYSDKNKKTLCKIDFDSTQY